MQNAALLEHKNMKVAIVPVDMNTAAITGLRASLAKGDRIAIVVNMGASTAAVAEFTLKQHNAASAGTSKALSVANAYFVKAGTATVWTKTEPTSAASVYDLSTTFAADAGQVVFEIQAEDLDVTNNFTHVSVDVADSTAAKLISAIFIMSNCNHLPPYDQAI